MEDMDIDINDNDPIKCFLQHKLKEMELYNEELQQQITHRKDLLTTLIEKMASKLSINHLEILQTWQKVNNGKWVIGIHVKNTSADRFIENVNIMLEWNLSTPLTYSIYKFCQYQQPKLANIDLPDKLKLISLSMEKKQVKDQNPLDYEWIETQKIRKCVCIIVAFEIPQLIDKTQCEIAGILTYQFDGKYYQLNTPKFFIKTADFCNDLYAVKSFEVINGDEQAYFVTLITNERNDLVVQLPSTSYTNLGNILEFDCKFRKVNLLSRTRQFFFIVSVADSINGTFIELEAENETIYNFTVYARNQNSLHLLLHYLYQTVPNILVLPNECKDKLLELQNEEDESLLYSFQNLKLKEFGNILEAQVNLIEKFCVKQFNEVPENTLVNEIEDYQQFRNELVEVELRCDRLYITCSKYFNSNGGDESSNE